MEDDILDEELDLKSGDLSQAVFAGFGVRLAAAIVDSLIVIPMYFFVLLFDVPAYITTTIMSLLYIVYKPLMEYQYGATLGKMLLRIMVVNEHYRKIELSQAISRNIFWLIPSAITAMGAILFSRNQALNDIINSISTMSNFLGFVSVIVVLFNTQKQGFHDMLAKTYCVYKAG